METIKKNILDFLKNQGGKIIISLFIFVIGILIIKLIIKALKKILKKSRLDPICHKFLLSMIKIGLYVVLVIIALSNLGIETTSMVAVLGAAGLAIGLALQDSLSNLAGGFILLFTKPFNVGDYIQIDTISGTVKHINILQTKLDTADNKAIYIPNGQVSSGKIINFSHETTRRLDLIFSIGYNDDFQKAKKIINNIINKHEFALKDPEPVVRVCEHADNSIKIAAKVWVLTESYWDLNYDLLESVKIAFDQNGIEIPYNQMDIYIKENNRKQGD